MAEAAYKASDRGDPRSVLPHLALASFYLQSQRTAEAEEEFKAALALDPTSRDAQQSLAFFTLKHGKPDLAEQIYIQLAQSRRQDPGQQVILANFIPTGKAGESDRSSGQSHRRKPKVRHCKEDVWQDLYLLQKDYGKATEIADQI